MTMKTPSPRLFLISKSASVALTNTGLKLKATIEQLREQVQNIE